MARLFLHEPIDRVAVDVDVESLVEIEGRVHVGVGGDAEGGVAVIVENLGQRHRTVAQDPVLLEGDPEPARIEARQHGGDRRPGPAALGVGSGEANAALGQRVQFGARPGETGAVATQSVGAQRIEDDDGDVRLRSRFGRQSVRDTATGGGPDQQQARPGQ